MGVDVYIYINNKARLRDVADVIGILAGNEPYKQKFSGSWSDGWSAEVDNVETKSGCMPECAEILVKAPDGGKLVDGQESHWVLWHWEPSRYNNNYHVICPPATPFWIAVGKKLADFFGGKLDYNDCDDSEIDYEKKRGKVRLGEYAEDGEGWEKLQEAKLKLKPLSQADMKEALKHAAYKEIEKV
jgi:hypothetical protein